MPYRKRPPSPGSLTALHPRLICLHAHWRGYLIPFGMESKRRWAVLFRSTEAFLSHLQNDSEVFELLTSQPRSVPTELLEPLVRLARKKKFLLYLKGTNLCKRSEE